MRVHALIDMEHPEIMPVYLHRELAVEAERHSDEAEDPIAMVAQLWHETRQRGADQLVVKIKGASEYPEEVLKDSASSVYESSKYNLYYTADTGECWVTTPECLPLIFIKGLRPNPFPGVPTLRERIFDCVLDSMAVHC